MPSEVGLATKVSPIFWSQEIVINRLSNTQKRFTANKGLVRPHTRLCDLPPCPLGPMGLGRTSRGSFNLRALSQLTLGKKLCPTWFRARPSQPSATKHASYRWLKVWKFEEIPAGLFSIRKEIGLEKRPSSYFVFTRCE